MVSADIEPEYLDTVSADIEPEYRKLSDV